MNIHSHYGSGAAGVSTGRRQFGPARGGRWVIAAAAAVIALVLGVAGVRASLVDDGHQVYAGEPSTGGPHGSGSQPAGDVTFEVLHVGLAGEESVGTLRSASTSSQLGALWADLVALDGRAGPDAVGPVPDAAMFADRVVVSIVIPDDACPPTLSGFQRVATEAGEPGRLVPQFVEADTPCDQPLIPKRFVVALQWASTGDRFVLVAGDGDRRGAEGASALSEIQLDRTRPDPVLVDVELDATTAIPDGELTATVVVSNNTGHPIAIGYCGNEFAVGLESDEVDQSLAFPACREEGAIVPGTSRFHVRILTTYGSCTAAPDPTPPTVACLSGGGIPALPPGEYRTHLYPPDGIDADAPPVTVTLT